MGLQELNDQIELFKRYKRLFNQGKITDIELLDLLKTLKIKNEIDSLNGDIEDIKLKTEINEYIELFNSLTFIKELL